MSFTLAKPRAFGYKTYRIAKLVTKPVYLAKLFTNSVHHAKLVTKHVYHANNGEKATEVHVSRRLKPFVNSEVSDEQ